MLTTRSLGVIVGASAFFLSVNAQFGGGRGGRLFGRRFGRGDSKNSGDDNDNSGDNDANLTLDTSLVAQIDGQGDADAGQADSLTSDNNFIDFCANKIRSDGQQLDGGGCITTPMGDTPDKTLIPSAKFIGPVNNDVIQAGQTFDINMAINNLATGTFTNPDTTYYAAPQQKDGQGLVIGHSHFVIEAIDDNNPPDPLNFAFFKGVNGAANNGVLTETVQDGLPAGTYRLSSINAAANHQPVLAPIAQHGSIDDSVTFTVSDNAGGGDDGQCNNDDNNNNNRKRDVHQIVDGLTWNQRRALKRREEYQERYRARRDGPRAHSKRYEKKWYKPL